MTEKLKLIYHLLISQIPGAEPILDVRVVVQRMRVERRQRTSQYSRRGIERLAQILFLDPRATSVARRAALCGGVSLAEAMCRNAGGLAIR
jgi:hypothetical protein